MKKSILLMAIVGIIMSACTKNDKDQPVTTDDNPFFVEWTTPFGTAPFEKIKNEHYLPALKKGIEEKKAEIAAIADSKEEPTFENTIVALDNSGALLRKVSGVFFNLTSAKTDEELMKISQDVTPLISGLSDDIYMNENLFARIKQINDRKAELNLTTEQEKLLDKYYKGFIRGGANLNPQDKEKLKKINEELAMLELTFEENVLKETNGFEMVLDKQEDLAGLPQSVIDAAAEEAKAKNMEGKWLFSIQKPSLIPFITYSDNRDLRNKMLMAYANMGNNNNENDNKENAAKIASLRVEKAHILGYATWADYVLEDNMAKTPAKVNELLAQIWNPAVARAKREAKDLQAMIDKEGGKFKLEPWDWWYYAEKLRKEKYDLDEEQLRPYFKIENVRDGAFMLANKLWGITFEERSDISKYHEDVTVFEVKDKDGSHIGILYTDYFPRASKRGGAWMNAYRKQQMLDGKEITPIICNVCNFSKPTADKPSLLSFEEVTTLFHEFGHALHGLLSECNYVGISGTDVSRDFVELPSQIMENWAGEPQMLKLYAKHYETGEVIPDELIQKISNSSKFNQGFVTTEYTSAALLDMDWHTMKTPEKVNTMDFEKAALDQMGLIPEIIVRYRSPYFRHVFGGGYDAGYYSYIWAAVLDADAFEAFKETNIFDQKTAQLFRDNILAKGGSDDPMKLYVQFRGSEPGIKPLLKRRGLMD